MKLRHILLTGLAALSLASCGDFLEVEAPSAYTDEFVYNYKSEIERSLNGVYAQALVDNLYGSRYQGTFIYNSDVDMKDFNANSHSHDAFQRFDGDEQASSINGYWNASYNLIEYANKFIEGVENSKLMKESAATGEEDPDLLQWLGEAKCLRAMAYHDLVVMFGDVPFVLEATSNHGADYVAPVVDRQEIQDALIADLQSIAPKMKSTASVTVEHCSKEFAYGLIARIALTAGGYSLRPDKTNPTSYGTMQRPDNYKKYYQTAMDAAAEVIESGTHQLSLDFQDVFVNECNYKVVNNDDPIFELPFAKMATGCTGNLQGPKYDSNEGNTVGPWGSTAGSVTVSAFYRFLFRDNDLRREFVNGMWNYKYFMNADNVLVDSVHIKNDRTLYNNKWSKLWTDENNALGSQTSTATGINFPYMRYADILLMYAETANELNDGPTPEAVEALSQVHKRAFADGDPQFIADAQASKEAFHKAVMDERKWEFAGENSRWRDLVRTNTYAEELAYSFLRYYAAAMQNAGGGAPEYYDLINAHDGYNVEAGEQGYIDNLPEKIWYHQYSLDEPITAAGFLLKKKEFYGYQFDSSINILKKYPLQKEGYKSLRIHNAYAPAKKTPTTGDITKYGFKATGWLSADFFQWGDSNNGVPNDYVKYSFFGYIRCDANGNVLIVKDGATTLFDTSYLLDTSKLPVVRYILPFPKDVIQRSVGQYKNYYGY